MDGNKNTNQELPKPQQEATGEYRGANNQEGFASINPELHVQPMPGEKQISANNAYGQAMTLAAPASDVTQAGATPQDDSSQASPHIADDNDVIEKEWVDKAKVIVSRTQGDPHAKSKELTHLKKDYIQKRYGKVIKVPRDESLAA